MTSWILYSIITGALVAVAAQCAEWILKSARRPVRAVWMVAIGLTVAFTLTAPLRTTPKIALDLSGATLVETVGVPVMRVPTLLERTQDLLASLLHAVTAPLQRVTEAAATLPQAVDTLAMMLAAASAFVALCVLFAVYGRSVRERIKWPSMMLLGKAVRVTPNVGPAVLGLAPPEIVVPQWVLLRSAEEQRLVLEHESEHVRAHDPMLLMAACVAVALMPWNPAMWFMWSRIRLAVELDCDRRVLKRGVQKPAYGQLLVELSSSRPWMSPSIPAFSWGTSHLEQRLVAMTTRPKRFAMLRRVANGAVVATALVAAARAEMPAPEALQAMDVSHLNGASIAPTLMLAPQAPVTAQDTITRRKKPASPTTVEGKRAVTKPAARKVVTDSASPTFVRYVNTADGATRILRTSKPTSAQDTVIYIIPDSLGRRRYNVSSRGIDSSGMASARYDSVMVVEGTRIMSDSAGTRIRVRSQSGTQLKSPANEPLIFVDGVLMPPGSMELIKANTIESVEVLKGAGAITVYGPAAEHGVIVIKLKRP